MYAFSIDARQVLVAPRYLLSLTAECSVPDIRYARRGSATDHCTYTGMQYLRDKPYSLHLCMRHLARRAQCGRAQPWVQSIITAEQFPKRSTDHCHWAQRHKEFASCPAESTLVIQQRVPRAARPAYIRERMPAVRLAPTP